MTERPDTPHALDHALRWIGLGGAAWTVIAALAMAFRGRWTEAAAYTVLVAVFAWVGLPERSE